MLSLFQILHTVYEEGYKIRWSQNHSFPILSGDRFITFRSEFSRECDVRHASNSSLFFSLRSSSRRVSLLTTLHFRPIFPSMACFREQFLREMWPIQLIFIFFSICRMFLSFLTLIRLPGFSNYMSDFPILNALYSFFHKVNPLNGNIYNQTLASLMLILMHTFINSAFFGVSSGWPLNYVLVNLI